MAADTQTDSSRTAAETRPAVHFGTRYTSAEPRRVCIPAAGSGGTRVAAAGDRTLLTYLARAAKSRP